MTTSYHPESYWSDVAGHIDERAGHNILAGDDSPYYRYKRKRFLNLLTELDHRDKHILELGSGPGGNIKTLLEHGPSAVTGADISSKMIEISSGEITDNRAQFVKIDGEHLPFAENEFDTVFSATVLQHNTDDEMMKKILRDMCRVSKDRLYLFERIEDNLKGDDLCMGRPVDYYKTICAQEGFELISTKFINIQVSYWVCGVIRKIFNKSNRKEGEQITRFSALLQKTTLPITSLFDNIFSANRDLARLEFVRKK